MDWTALGAGAGAAADEMSRQREQDRQQQMTTSMLGLQRIETAAKQQNLDDSTAVQQHIQDWKAGRAKILNGDYSGLNQGVTDYNNQTAPFNDGHYIAMQSTPNGDVVNHVSPDGAVVSSAPMNQDTALKMYDAGMREKLKYTSPAFFSHYENAESAALKEAQDRAAKQKVAETYAGAKTYVADVNGDTRLDAAGIRADATTDSAGIRAGATTGAATTRADASRDVAKLRPTSTPTQDANNAMIDAARQAVAGMSPQEILKRTAKTSNTGRENRDYDPALAHQAALANRRKIGADDWFDQRQGQQPFAGKPVTEMTEQQLQQFGGAAGPGGAAKIDAELTRRSFAGDPTMQGHKLGDLTPSGYKVFDAQGRHVGYFRR